jgi:hypothetical protein
MGEACSCLSLYFRSWIVNVPQFSLHFSFLHFDRLIIKFCSTKTIVLVTLICVAVTTIQISTSLNYQDPASGRWLVQLYLHKRQL